MELGVMSIIKYVLHEIIQKNRHSKVNSRNHKTRGIQEVQIFEFCYLPEKEFEGLAASSESSVVAGPKFFVIGITPRYQVVD